MIDFGNQKGIRGLIRVIITFFTSVVILLLLLLFYCLGFFQLKNEYVDTYTELYPNIRDSPSDIYSQDYDVSNLDDSEENAIIKYGYEVFVNTPNYIGPNNGKDEMIFSGNNLSCNNCHLLAGTKAFSAPLIGVINRFPQYRGREDKIRTIEERIHGCMERSMNGRRMEDNQKEMKALVGYLTWLNRYAPADGRIEGEGFVKVELPNRAVNLQNGEKIFNNTCVECHQKDGQGVRFEESFVYQYPPLWGDDSFNNGAGMTRVITATEFIKGNMPYGTSYLSPVLTDEEAYDVAGYINQQPRPEKSNLEIDFPDLLKKPVSTPYPPYVDSFTTEQHQLGPFQPIMEYYLENYGVKKSK